MPMSNDPANVPTPLPSYYRYCRAPGNYDPAAVSDETGLVCDDPSLTRQDSKDEADINVIVRDFGVTGVLPQGVRVPSYGDFDTVSDYQSALEAIRSADASFYAMPANVRERFSNNPQLFVEFCSDPSNLEEMRTLGLAVPAPLPASDVPPSKEKSS